MNLLDLMSNSLANSRPNKIIPTDEAEHSNTCLARWALLSADVHLSRRTVSQPRLGVAAKRTGWAVPGMAGWDPEGLGNI